MAPVAAHIIGRASCESGVVLSDRTWIDALEVYETQRRASERDCQPEEW